MRARWITGLAIAVGLGAVGVAHAATLGLSAQSLASWSQAGGVGAPTILTCDNFALAAPTGSALNGRPVQLPARCGTGVWTVHRGTWAIVSSQLQGSGTTNSTASINAGQTNISAETTILNSNGSSRTSGVAINHTGGTRTFLLARLSGPSTVQLILSTNGSISTIASATATITASTVLRITRNGTTVTVSVNGVLRITHTLTSAQVTTLASGTFVGLYWNSGSTIRFTAILATTVYPP